MSLLLDALKKAAEKNAQKEPSELNDATKIDPVESLDDTKAVDNTEIVPKGSVPEETPENITEMELAQIINAQKKVRPTPEEPLAEPQIKASEPDDSFENEPSLSDSTVDDEKTDIRASNLPIEDVASEPSLSSYNDDEDPSLKLALSDEEILLTDDDVTEFLGSDELSLRLAEDDTMTGESNFIDNLDNDDTEFRLSDKTITQSLNLVEPPSEFSESDNDTTYTANQASTVSNAAQTTNLNSLTNDVTVSIQDQTSTETFASDNYDRTLVKLDDDVSKVFTGMKSVDSGAAMTPDFAKKVFIHKSTTLRRRNYKIYTLISLILFISIGVLALFEMQTKMDDIDTSLMQLKRNPVPSELRFQRQEKTNDDLSVLQGRVDTQAMNLLKSLRDETNNDNIVSNEEINDTIATEQAEEQITNKASDAIIKNNDTQLASGVEGKEKPDTEEQEINGNQKQAAIIADQPVVKSVAKVKAKGSIGKVNKNIAQKAKAKKSSINIVTKTAISKESIWLKDAYSAFEKGNIELASMNYSKVLKKNPTNRDALLGQAAIYSGQNKNGLAIDNYQAVLLENPKDPLAMASLITASTMSPIESESRLKLLHRESPKATYLLFALGNVISAQNRWKEAQQYYFMAYQANPSNPDYAYNLAVSLEQINKPDLAVSYYEQAVKNAQSSQASFNVDITQQRIEVLR